MTSVYGPHIFENECHQRSLIDCVAFVEGDGANAVGADLDTRVHGDQPLRH